MSHSLNEKTESFGRLLTIMDELRENCPWDKKQTFDSLRTLTIEEVYELAEAVISEKPEEIKKELGDLLLHVVFYARLGSEEKSFDIADVIHSLCDKLIYRHPHIYGDTTVKDAVEVLENWEKLKLSETEKNKTVLGGVPTSLPALVKAHRIQDKARGVGFDWDHRSQIWEKVKEEIAELQAEIDNTDEDKIEAEFGDLFFSLINAARLYNINPENALERTNRKFISRFNYLEKETIAKGMNLKEMNLEEMNRLWEQAKQFDPGK
jgi:MazG family protein